MPPAATLHLVDNGSLAPPAVFSLRRIAAALAQKIGADVRPASVLHSDKVPPAELDGVPAETIEASLRRSIALGEFEHVVLPLFFGPSGAITDYLPRRIARLKERHPALDVRIASWIDAPGDGRLASILADQVCATLRSEDSAAAASCVQSAMKDSVPQVREPDLPAVLLVDHGSPLPAVTAIRDRLAGELRERLLGKVSTVLPASMERRPEPDYDFNEPLLERALDASVRAGSQDIVVVQLFLSPGRHAGPDGDIASICAAACGRHPGLRIRRTQLVGEHPALTDILADRLRASL